MKKSTNHLAFCIQGVIGASIAMQSVPAMSEQMLEEIVVTARKKQESLQDVPVAVTVFTEAKLEKLGLSDFQSLAFSNPNVRMSPGGTGGVAVTRVALRGNIQNSSNATVDTPVAIYQDGHSLAKPMLLDGTMVDVEGVQTLRGPQGTLFGRNSTGGAMLFNTVQANPENGLTGYIKATAGEYGTARATGAINIPVTDDFAARLVAHHSERDGYADYDDGIERGDKDSDTFRLNFTWNISDATSLQGTYQRHEVEGTGATLSSLDAYLPNPTLLKADLDDDLPNDINVFGSPAFARKASPSDKSDGKSDFYGLRLTRELADATLKVSASYREWELEKNRGVSPSLLDSNDSDVPGVEETSFEVQYSATALNDSLEWITGLYYYEEDIFEDSRTYMIESAALGPSSGVLAVWSSPELEGESLSAYLQGTYSVSEALNLTAGLRYTDDEKQAQSIISPAGTVSSKLNYDEGKVTWLVSADYFATKDVMLYASAATGYRAGGTTGGASPKNDGSLNYFAPEEVISYEVGTKGDYLDGQVRLNAALFYQDYESYQYFTIKPDPATGNPSRVLDGTDAIIKGAELELTVLLPADFTLSATYGYTDSEVSDSESPVDGQELPLVEKYNYSVTLSKLLSTDIGDFDFTAAYSWRDGYTNEFETFGSNNHLDDLEDVGLLNASVTYTMNERWGARLWGTNLTDEEYFNHKLYNAAASVGGIYFGDLAAPRMVGVDVTYSF